MAGNAAAMTAACVDAETFDHGWYKMVSRSRWWSALLAVAMVALASEGSANDANRTEQRSVRIPGADYEVRLDGAERIANPALGEPLLAVIGAWLSIEFDLPIVRDHPRIELVPPAEIAALRYRGRFPSAGTERALTGHSPAAAERDTVAVYSDSTRTIYLADDWTGGTPAELSVLVHEMVHHLQNLAGLRYECPQAREKLAYLAQERWLALFGRDLAQDFELDGFTLLVKTKCLH
jgi:Domain of unknown function (DUF6647)